jgi:hypothetical protein
MNKTSTILQTSTSVVGRRNSISQPAQSPFRCTQCSTAWSIAYNARRIASAVAHSAGASLHSALRTAYNCGFTRFLSPEAEKGFGLKNLVNPPSVTSNFRQTTMRIFIAIFILTGLFSCTDRQTKNSITQTNEVSKNEVTFVITAINANLPLRLDKINLEDKNNTIHLNDGIVSKIEKVIKDYAKDFEFYDSTQTYTDTYINTIRLHDSLWTIYVVLLKHYPTEELNSRVLFYDNQKKEFLDNTFDFNLWVLYNIDNGKLKPTDLKNHFKINSPEIELIDFNKDKINDYKFVRLWHNGTFNAIHTTILTLSNSKIDTLHFDEKPIGNEELLHGRK